MQITDAPIVRERLPPAVEPARKCAATTSDATAGDSFLCSRKKRPDIAQQISTAPCAALAPNCEPDRTIEPCIDVYPNSNPVGVLHKERRGNDGSMGLAACWRTPRRLLLRETADR